MKVKLIFLFLLMPVSLGFSADIIDLDNYIDQSRQAWNVSQMSVSIVKDGEIVMEKGYEAFYTLNLVSGKL
jgi:hypothetical protein